MSISDLAAEYNGFVAERSNTIKGTSSERAKNLLIKFRNAGRYLSDPRDREILSAWCRDIGDTIYRITGEYPSVRISPMELYAALESARDIKNVRDRINELISIAVSLPSNERDSVISEVLSDIYSTPNSSDRFQLLRAVAEQLPEPQRAIVLNEAASVIPGSESTNRFSEQIITNLPKTSSKPLIPHQIPLPPLDFMGRKEEIDEISNSIILGKKIIGLHGVSGIGKTTLAIILANRLEKHFQDGQIFIDLRGTGDSPLTPTESIAHIIHACAPTLRLSEDKNKLQDLCFSLLKGKKMLLLLDNVANREQIESFIPPSSCTMIITSRTKLVLPGMFSIELGVLSHSDSSELLLTISKRIDSQVGELSWLCGYIPMALRNAASALNERSDISIVEYMQKLNDAKNEQELIDASLSLSDSMLSIDKRRLWYLLSVFPADFNPSAAKHVCEIESHSAIKEMEELNELAKWNLVDFLTPRPANTYTEGRYRLHELGRNFVDSLIDPAIREVARQRHAVHYINILSEAESLFKQGEEKIIAGLNLFDCEWPNIQAGHAWSAGVIHKAEQMTTDEGSHEYEIALRLCTEYPEVGANVLNLRLPSCEWVCWLETALVAARKLLDRKKESLITEMMGNAHRDLCDPRMAIEFYKQASIIDRELRDKLSEARVLCELGSAYYDLGNNRQAIEFLQQALVIGREMGNRSLETNILGKLGNAYYHLGDSHQAIEFFQKALTIDREIGDRRAEGETLDNLGNAYCDLGEARQAIEFLEQSLAIAHEIGDRRTEAKTLSNLGDTYFGLGEINRAIEFLEMSLENAREIEDRQIEAKILNSLGAAYETKGEVRLAIKLLEQSLAIARKMGDRSREARSLISMGNSYFDLGEIRRSIEFYEQSLAITREVNHPLGESKALVSLGNAYCNLGEIRQAIEFYEQSLAIARKVRNRNMEGKILCNLGIAYSEIGETHRAIELFGQSLEIARELEDRQGEGNALGDLGLANFSIGEVQRAVEFYKQSLDIAQKVGDRLMEGQSLANMSLALAELGDRTQAIDHSIAALKIFEQIDSPLKEKMRQQLRDWQN